MLHVEVYLAAAHGVPHMMYDRKPFITWDTPHDTRWAPHDTKDARGAVAPVSDAKSVSRAPKRLRCCCVL